jgi:hypothetical protein
MGNASSITKKFIVNDIDTLNNIQKISIKNLILNEINNKINVQSETINGYVVFKYYGYFIEDKLSDEILNKYNYDLKYMYFDIPDKENNILYILLSHTLIDYLKNILEEQNYIYTILKQKCKDSNSNYQEGYITIKLKEK